MENPKHNISEIVTKNLLYVDFTKKNTMWETLIIYHGDTINDLYMWGPPRTQMIINSKTDDCRSNQK